MTEQSKQKNREAAKRYYYKNRDKKIALAAIQCQKPRYKYTKYRWGAKERGLEFKLTFKEFKKYWQKPCYYCGDEIKTIGLDRINNNKGYIKGNIVPCCISCNKLKKRLDIADFLKQIIKISNNIIKKSLQSI